MNKIPIDEQWLHQKIVVERLSMNEVAKLLNVNHSTVMRRLRKLNILKPRPYYEDKDWLFQKRVVEKLSLKEIQKLCGGIDKKTIRKWIAFHEIPAMVNISQARKKKMVTLVCGYCGDSFEKEKYYVNGKINRNQTFLCSKECMIKQKSELISSGGIPSFFRDISGDKHPQWKGGKVKLPCTVCGKVDTEYHPYQVEEFNQGLKVPCCSSSCAFVVSMTNAKYFETSIELAIKNELISNSIKFIPQYIYLDRYSIDFYLEEYDIAIECDGDYWHGNPTRFPVLNDSQLKTQKKDLQKNKFLKKNGTILFRFWETDIKEDVQKCFQQVLDKISEIDSLRKKVIE
jgi:very-short-patch-repair endonuclease